MCGRNAYLSFVSKGFPPWLFTCTGIVIDSPCIGNEFSRIANTRHGIVSPKICFLEKLYHFFRSSYFLLCFNKIFSLQLFSRINRFLNLFESNSDQNLIASIFSFLRTNIFLFSFLPFARRFVIIPFVHRHPVEPSPSTFIFDPNSFLPPLSVAPLLFLFVTHVDRTASLLNADNFIFSAAGDRRKQQINRRRYRRSMGYARWIIECSRNLCQPYTTRYLSANPVSTCNERNYAW